MKLAIIQARMGSTRLPGKVLMSLMGMPMLQYQINRVKDSALLDKIVVATTTESGDDAIVKFCISNGINYFRGSESNVLERYYQCATQYKATTIIRLTADCPFSDPVIIDKAIELFEATSSDYASNTAPPETSFWPDGSDVEVFSYKSLKFAYEHSKDLHEQEHVTFYFWKGGGKEQFHSSQLKNSVDNSSYRFTVDYPEDFELAQKLSQIIAHKKIYGHCDELVEIIKCNPQLKNINAKYYFGIGWNAE